MGKLIVIDGLDGSGKATQTDLLFDNLKKKENDIIKISFPNYEDDSSSLIKMYLSGEFGASPDSVNPFAASSFYAVDRYASYKKYWEEKYLTGYTVICDRYVTSNLIHQMSKLQKDCWKDFINWVEDYEYNRLQLPRPDKIIYLDLDLNISQKLIEKRYNNDKLRKDIHEKDIFYLKKCREAARYMSKLESWDVIKCNNEDNEVYDKEYLSLKILERIKNI